MQELARRLLTASSITTLNVSSPDLQVRLALIVIQKKRTKLRHKM